MSDAESHSGVDPLISLCLCACLSLSLSVSLSSRLSLSLRLFPSLSLTLRLITTLTITVTLHVHCTYRGPTDELEAPPSTCSSSLPPPPLPPFPWLTGVSAPDARDGRDSAASAGYHPWHQSDSLTPHTPPSSSSSPHTSPSSSSPSSSSLSSSSLTPCEVHLYRSVDACVDLVLQSAPKEVLKNEKEVEKSGGEVEKSENEGKEGKESEEGVTSGGEMVEDNRAMTLSAVVVEVGEVEKSEVEVERKIVDEVEAEEVKKRITGSLKSFLSSMEALETELLNVESKYVHSSSSSSSSSTPSSSSSSSSPMKKAGVQGGGIEGVERGEGGEGVEGVEGEDGEARMLSPDWLRSVSLVVRTLVSWCTLLLRAEDSLPCSEVVQARSALERFIRTYTSSLPVCVYVSLVHRRHHLCQLSCWLHEAHTIFSVSVCLSVYLSV